MAHQYHRHIFVYTPEVYHNIFGTLIWFFQSLAYHHHNKDPGSPVPPLVCQYKDYKLPYA